MKNIITLQKNDAVNIKANYTRKKNMREKGGFMMTCISLVDYIGWFSENHIIQDLNKRIDGVIVAPIDEDYLVRTESVKRCK